ncbi:MAG: NifB/NifX family molybdenum-iron cluster-binding protein [Caldicoprobacterales bacterium]|jgi:predicted Fe-Mo cluster-binding NifX family protein|nr:NifB/NifX family molybdenum-iron cluster-binding protein [Bacillota bacterium]NLH59480.1 dinitrogenase iron-molybdenum cofactor [Clostridiales bacterium]
MEKIAVASDNGMVTDHFGHCEAFVIFEANDGQIVSKNTIKNPGHKPGFLPNFLNDMGVKLVISGGMGAGAIDIFNDHGIKVIIGCSGSAELVVKAYLKGELESTASACHGHDHKHDHDN